MKAALLQLNASDDVAANLAATQKAVRDAAQAGAGFVLTPEVTNMVSFDRDHQREHLRTQADDPTLEALQDTAKQAGIWLSIGSLALKSETDRRFVNRSFLIDPVGDIRVTYDKIHMFDVTLSNTDVYRESAAFRPGDAAKIFETPFGVLGFSVCYDLRFPLLYRKLAQAGAEILLVPAAFTPQTGQAHWEPLLRARAIENGAWVLAAGQTGTHRVQRGQTRQTFGHSMAIDPWGAVEAMAGTQPETIFVDVQRERAAEVRQRIPSLLNEQHFTGPDDV